MSDYRALLFFKDITCVILIYFSPTGVMIFEYLLDEFLYKKIEKIK